MRTSFTLALAFSTAAAFGQTANVPNNIRATNTLDGLADGGINPNEILYGIPMAPGDVIGDDFLNENWDVSTVVLKGSEKKIEGYRSRYNISDNEIFFQTKNGETRVLKGTKVKSFTLTDGKTGMVYSYVNASKFLEDGIPVDGFVEVLADGKNGLYKRTELSIIKPNYRQEFDMGSKDTKIVKKITYYRNDGVNLIKLNVSGKKKLAKSFDDQQDKVEKYIDAADNFNPDNEFHLAGLFNYLNQ